VEQQKRQIVSERFEIEAHGLNKYKRDSKQETRLERFNSSVVLKRSCKVRG